MDFCDLSQLTFDEFVTFFFNHDMVTEEYWYRDPSYFDCDDLTGEGAASPKTIVEHLTHLFRGFDEVAAKFSPQQINAGIWAILGVAPFCLQKYLWLPSAPLALRLACIRSMYDVYANHVSKSTVPVMENCFYMWWDLVARGFWQYLHGIEEGNTKALNQEQTELLEAIFETLCKILALSDLRTQADALHGLGHLHHPGVRKVLHQYLDQHRHDLGPEGIKWLEKCRDGTVM